MASRNVGEKSTEILADCTNTPISRPRRSCGGYKSHSATKSKTTLRSPKPKIPSIDVENLQPQNSSNDSENASVSLGVSGSEQNEDPFRASNSDFFVKNFGTLSANAPAGDGFWFPEDSEDAGQNIRVYSARRQKGRNSVKTPSSCPPLGSSAEERSAKVRKRYSLGASEVLPKSGMSKKKLRRSDNLTSANDGKCSLPEDFVRQQQAHFAEIDAFVLQEEDMLGAE